jgi:ABC-type polysaccharide/polyol phosphate transport system ATPase subunit
VKNEVAIDLQDVFWSYRTILDGERTLKGFAIALAKGKRFSYSKENAHLRGISLQINHGEHVGVIGRNGSGKSTLLKLIAGVVRPDYGTVDVDGSITPLIDIGTGMNPELTCRENIYLSASYLGFSRRQTEKAFNSIVDWAEVAEILDNPLHTLSTGMQSRLAFAVSTCQKPEIVLIDEILSVGDISFQAKSTRRMQDLKEQGSAVVIVTHDLSYLRVSVPRVIWVQDGQIKMDGETKAVIDSYEASF